MHLSLWRKRNSSLTGILQSRFGMGAVCYSVISPMRFLLFAFVVSVAALLWAAWRIRRAIRRPPVSVPELHGTPGLSVTSPEDEQDLE